MRKPTIAIIDDDPIKGGSLADILKTRGYEAAVVQAWSGESGVLNNGGIDVVLIDLKQPDLTGPEALDRVRVLYPSSEVIILTAYDTLDPALEAAKTWAFAYVLKPFECDQLLLHILRAVEKREAAARLRECEERLETLARNMHAELERARKAAAACRREKEELVAEIKKELTTPLNLITGCSTILLDDHGSELSEKHKEFLHHILNSGRALQRTVLSKPEFLAVNYRGWSFSHEAETAEYPEKTPAEE
jgi:DNA-binding response OmpR family regulator